MKQINSIRLENFICYKDEIIEFKNETGTYIFVGDNNVGKSTLFNAISWCFYETTPFKKSNKEINVVSDNRGDNEKTSVEVIVTLDSKKYAITRTHKASGSDLNVSVIEGKNRNRNPIMINKERLIEKFLPKSIQHLFIFDGELLKNLFDENTKEGLRTSVKVINEVNILERSKRLLNEEINKLSRKESKNDSLTKEMETAIEDIGQYEVKIKQTENRIAELKREISKLEKIEVDLDKQILANGKFDTLLNNKNRVSGDIKKLEIEISSNESKMYEFINNILPMSLLIEEISHFNIDIESEISEGKLPSPIEPSEIDKYIHEKICICGREIDEDSKNHMEKLKEDYRKINERKYISDATQNFYHILDNIKKLNYEAVVLRETIAKQKQDLNKLIAEREDYEDQLDNVQGSNSEGLKENRSDIRAALNNFLTEKGTHEAELVAFNNLLSGAINNRNLLLNNLTKQSTNAGRMDFLRGCEKLITDTIQKVDNVTIKLLSEKINTTFMSLTSTSNYTTVSMSSSYEVSLVTKNGTVRQPNSLGTGYHKMLGLSLIIALSDVLDNSDFPIMVDNPYDSINHEHQVSINEYLSNLSKTKQVVITALENQDIDQLLKKSDKTQIFKIDQTNNISTIKEMNNA